MESMHCWGSVEKLLNGACVHLLGCTMCTYKLVVALWGHLVLPGTCDETVNDLADGHLVRVVVTYMGYNLFRQLEVDCCGLVRIMSILCVSSRLWTRQCPIVLQGFWF